jgi:hypothetical protein
MTLFFSFYYFFFVFSPQGKAREPGHGEKPVSHCSGVCERECESGWVCGCWLAVGWSVGVVMNLGLGFRV